MKKIYAFVAAALMSASLFAEAPTIAELAETYDVANNVVLCVNFTGDAEVCNNIYFCGTPNAWAESFDGCPQFRPVANHDGWYAAQAPYEDGFQGKPIQAKADGSFSWDFQTGDPSAWKHVDGLEATIVAGYDNEANVSFGAAGAYIYEISYWKNHRTPCTAAVKHDYKVILYAPVCEGADYAPAIIGDFNNWTEGVTMDADIDDSGEVIYVATFNDEEGHGFKFRQAGISDWSNEILVYDAENDEWKAAPNTTLGSETVITIDYTEAKWSACGKVIYDDETQLDLVVTFKAPANAPAAGVEMMGSWDESTWQSGIVMEFKEGVYVANVTTTEAKEFKFREVGNWDNTVISADGKELGNFQFGAFIDEAKKNVVVDLSDDTKYIWKANYTEGIENVVLTEKAQKIVVDGVLYIVRDNKMFTIQGAQVR